MAIINVSVVPGDDLFRYAARYYNDATAWTLIGRANGLYDPYITTPATLIIPEYNKNRVNDGVLQS